MTVRPTLVLVHSPLVGPLTWGPVGECLRQAGYSVVVPSLQGVADAGPPYYPRFAAAVTDAMRSAEHRGAPMIVGHSGAGGLLPVVAEAVGWEVRAAVFVDAILPHPGKTWLDTASAELRVHVAGLVRDGRLPPWSEWFGPDAVAGLLPDADLRDLFVAELPELPLAYFEELAPDTADWPPRHCTYVRLSGVYDAEAAEAERRGWPTFREDADHLAMLTRPRMVADLLRRIADAATRD